MSDISVISAGKLLYDVLSNDTELGQNCNKVFPVIAEDTALLPYIEFSRTSVQVSPVKYQEPMSGACTAFYDVTCYAQTYSQSVAMAERVAHLLDSQSYQYTDESENTLTARSIILTGAEELWQGDAYAQRLTFQIRVQ